MRGPTVSPSRIANNAASAAGLVAIVVAFLALAAPFLPHTVDDAYITFRYSRQWALGAGPYFNRGEHVEGYSNFLLMLLLTPVIRAFGPEAAPPVAKAIGLVAAAAALAGSFFLARSLGRDANRDRARGDLAGVVAAGLVACSPGFAVNAVSGLETGLYACLVTWGVHGMAAGSSRGIRSGSLALSAAAVTRPEAPVILAAGWALAAARARWVPDPAPGSEARGGARGGPSAKDFTLAACAGIAAVLAQLVFRHIHYDGEWLPNTYYAKSSGGGDRAAYVGAGLASPFLGAAGLIAGILGWLIEPRSARVALVAGGVGLLGGLLPLAMGADWMMGYRLIVPYLAVLAAVVAVGWLRIALRVFRGRPALVAAALLATIPSSCWLQWKTRGELVHAATLATLGTETGHAALAEWLRKDARDGDSVALMDIGLVGFRCIGQTVIDLTGLTDRHIAKAPGGFLRKQYDPGYVLAKEPRYIVLAFTAPGDSYAPIRPGAPLSHFTGMEARLAGHPDFGRHYAAAARIAEPDRGGLGDVAARIGALEVFPYAVPNMHYLLALYRRHE